MTGNMKLAVVSLVGLYGLVATALLFAACGDPYVAPAPEPTQTRDQCVVSEMIEHQIDLAKCESLE